MRKELMYKLLLILAVGLVSVYLVIPPKQKVKLGLDLKGGIHLVLRVKTDDAIKSVLELRSNALVEQFTRRGLTYKRIDRDVKTASLVVVGADPVGRSEFDDVFKQVIPSWSVKESGGDLQLTMNSQEAAHVRDTAVTDTIERIRERVDAYGVAEPNIQRQGLSSDRILVQLPGVDNPERVKTLLSKPAFLEFKLVTYPPNTSTWSGTSDKKALMDLFGGKLPDGTDLYPQEVKNPAAGQPTTLWWPLTKASPISGGDLVMARRTQDTMGLPAVDFVLTPDAGTRFERLTRENKGRQLAIVIDGKVISAPNINGVINTNGIIQGHFSVDEAEDLAYMLRSGALPAGTLVLEERTVGPSLGLDSIRKGVSASIAGLVLSMGFMLVYYKGAGINAVIALILNVLLLLGVMAYFGATLSLPGIAGIILTFGMAFDANVLIFERIREELRLGKTVRAAVDAGFGKAFSAIFDSNLTTVVAAIFLIQFGTGPVKGFAVTLCIGVIASMFTAVFVSRALFQWRLGEGKRVEHLSI
ncbi:MAG TPA: protein translocase subunit SecD [Candidatus Saccharimonadales bacterium]|nr:protein translocase subunit SecD [Candidatus Saccharimonadales bacterium]